MLKLTVKFDDKDLFDVIKNTEATLNVGFWQDIYEENDKPYYALNAKGKPRRFGVTEAIPVATVAARNEYGVPEKNVPPRPFMRRTAERRFRKWHNFVKDRAPITLDMKKIALDLGDVVSNDIRQSIIDFDYPPNRPSTVKKKGFNDPLIDSGQMAESVRMEVK